MNAFRGLSPGRMALILMFFALLTTVCGLVYLFLTRLSRHVGPDGEMGDTSATTTAKLAYLLTVLLFAILLILIFVVGAYLVLRVGRAVTQKTAVSKPTEYVDAWGRYRLSQEQIDAATHEDLRDAERPDEPEDPDDAPEDEPPNPSSEG